MADTRLADISEFQENIDAPAYIGGGFRSLIARAHNGHRSDKQWPGRREYLRRQPFTSLGWYQYLVTSRDAAEQARDFVACIGPLRPNEYPILDLEEGSGNQTPRAEAWFRVVDAAYGFPATLYSGESFFHDNLGGVARWSGRPRWMAAYRSQEPRDAHELWQYTDKARFPGLAGGVDGNVFRGTDAQLLATMRRGGAAAVKPAGLPDDAILSSRTVARNKDGRLEEFIETGNGVVHHRWQKTPGGAWTDPWASLGAP